MAMPIKIPMASRYLLNTACVLAVTIGGFRFSFMDRTLEMQFLARALIDIGRQVKTAQEVDVADFLTCANSICTSKSEVYNQQCEKMKPLVQKLLDTGGAVTSDGLMQKISSRRDNEFVMHNIKETAGKPPSLKTQVFFLAPFDSGSDTGENNRRLLKDTLYATMPAGLNMFMERLTFVTDCAAVMSKVVG